MTLDWKEQIKNKLTRPSNLRPICMPPLPTRVIVEPAVVEPAVVEPAVVEPAIVEPAIVEPAVKLVLPITALEPEAEPEAETDRIAADDFIEADDVEITKSNFSVIERDLLIINPVEGIKKVNDDTHVLEWGRDRNAGFVVGRVMSPTPMFFTADGHSVHLEDSARGASIMIIGPDYDGQFIDRNAYTWTIGKAGDKLKAMGGIPRIWTALSDPRLYDSIWSNPSILKIVPAAFAHQKNSKGFISHSPMTFYFRRHEEFSPQNFLFENSVYGPNNGEFYLLTVLRLAYIMGFRNVYLYGIKVSNRVKEIIKNIDPMLTRNKFNVFDIDCDLDIRKSNINAAITNCIL